MAAVAESCLEKSCSLQASLQRSNRASSVAQCGQHALLSMPLTKSGPGKLRNAGFSKLLRPTTQRKNANLLDGKWKRISAIAAPIAPTLSDPSYRAKLAEEYGFTQIGEPVPPTVTLKNVIDSFPPEVFKIDNVKAWRTVAISVVSFAAGLFMIAKAPWYLLPLAWFYTGTAFTGFFVIGHDCAHKSFSTNKVLEDIVGTLVFMPLIYPYEPWRFKHDRHHAKTNIGGNVCPARCSWRQGTTCPGGGVGAAGIPLPPTALSRVCSASDAEACDVAYTYRRTQGFLGSFCTQGKYPNFLVLMRLVEDTAWHPVVKEEYDAFPSWMQLGLRLAMGPLRCWASIGHWLVWHFNLDNFRPSEKNRVKISLACVFAFMAIGWPLIIYKAGFMGWVKFWLMPWIGYHFWMSTFTMVHHTAPHIPFNDVQNWNSAQAQLGGTVHCDYPRWVELLCHDISVHIPHHISQKIPSYNLRLANQSLRQNWGKYLNEAQWSWRLMKTILTICHVYDEEKNYVAFDEGKEESKIYGALRRLMPNTP